MFKMEFMLVGEDGLSATKWNKKIYFHKFSLSFL